MDHTREVAQPLLLGDLPELQIETIGFLQVAPHFRKSGHGQVGGAGHQAPQFQGVEKILRATLTG